jgi:hypothetical protein
MPFNFMYNPTGLFGRMGMGYQQPQQNPYGVPQMRMPQMGISQMGGPQRAMPMPQMNMGMPSYMPPYLAQYMQRYGMQGMPQGMPQQMMPQAMGGINPQQMQQIQQMQRMQGMVQPQPMPMQGNPNSPYENQLPLGQNPYQTKMPQQDNMVQGRRAVAVQPPMTMGGSGPIGRMPPSYMTAAPMPSNARQSAGLEAAIAQLNAGRNSAMIPQGDTFQNNQNRQSIPLQGVFNSLRTLGI